MVARHVVFLPVALLALILHGCGETTTTTTTWKWEPVPKSNACTGIPIDHTKIIIGQNNADEVSTYQQVYQNELHRASGWGNGVSAYWPITDQAFDYDELIKVGVAAGAKLVNLAIWMGYQDPKANFKMLQDINNNKYDDNLDWLRNKVLLKDEYKGLTWYVRISYEISLQYWANPTGELNKPDDFYQPNQGEYQKAFKHVAAKLKPANVKTVFHPFRLYAQNPQNNMKMFPGDDVVDVIGISLFNNDVCQPWGDQGPPSEKDQYCDPNKKRYDQNMADMLGIARTMSKKPLVICESTTQPPKLDKDGWIETLKRMGDVVKEFNITQWTYIASDWNHQTWKGGTDFKGSQWGNNQLQVHPEVFEWWSECILKSTPTTTITTTSAKHGLVEREAVTV